MIAVAQPISEVLREVYDEDRFFLALFDFVDRFRNDPSPQLLEDEPSLLAGKFADDGVADAWIAVAVNSLALEQGFRTPLWTKQKPRILSKPWFAAKTPNLKAILLQESPAAFRVRNLFDSANVLSRA